MIFLGGSKSAKERIPSVAPILKVYQDDELLWDFKSCYVSNGDCTWYLSPLFKLENNVESSNRVSKWQGFEPGTVFTTYEWAQKARVFVTAKTFQQRNVEL